MLFTLTILIRELIEEGAVKEEKIKEHFDAAIEAASKRHPNSVIVAAVVLTPAVPALIRSLTPQQPVVTQAQPQAAAPPAPAASR